MKSLLEGLADKSRVLGHTISSMTRQLDWPILIISTNFFSTHTNRNQITNQLNGPPVLCPSYMAQSSKPSKTLNALPEQVITAR